MSTEIGKSEAIVNDLNHRMGYRRSSGRRPDPASQRKIEHYAEVISLHKDTLNHVNRFLSSINMDLEPFRRLKEEGKLTFLKFYRLFVKGVNALEKKAYALYKEHRSDDKLLFNNKNAMNFGLEYMVAFYGLIPFLHFRKYGEKLGAKLFIDLASKISPLITAMTKVHDNILSGLAAYWEDNRKILEADQMISAFDIDKDSDSEPVFLNEEVHNQAKRAIKNGYELSLSKRKGYRVPVGVRKKYKAKERDASKLILNCPGAVKSTLANGTRASAISLFENWMIKQFRRLNQAGLLKPALDEAASVCESKAELGSKLASSVSKIILQTLAA